jgi:hypothetical protein
MPGAAPISKILVHDDYTRIKGIVNETLRAPEEGVYMPECVTLGCPSFIYEEKGWDIETLH